MSDATTQTAVLSPTKPGAAVLWLRRTSQAVGLVMVGQWSWYGLFRCPFLVPFVSCQNCPVLGCNGRILALFWGVWALIGASALLSGRTFCGWVCPGGALNRILASFAPIKARSWNRLWTFGGIAILAAGLYAWFGLGQPRLAIPIRVGGFFESVDLTWTHATAAWKWRTGVLVGLIALGVLVRGFFCRFACPTGFLAGLIGRFSPARFRMRKGCTDCGRCNRLCPTSARPEEASCVDCGDCTPACPVRVIEFGGKS